MEMAAVSLTVCAISVFLVSNAKGMAGAHGQFVMRDHGIVLSFPFDPGLAAVLPRLPVEMGHVVLRSCGRAVPVQPADQAAVRVLPSTC